MKKLTLDSLTIIGSFPPPKGGVSIHIERLKNLCLDNYDISFIDESSNIKKEYFNIRTRKVFTYFQIIKKSNIIHIHSSIIYLRIFHIIISKIFFKKVVVTIHSYRNISKLKHFVNVVFLKFVDKIIFVNSDIQQRFKFPSNSAVKEAFIPPDIKQEIELPNWLKSKINDVKNEQGIILISNAWRIEEFNNEDLYGIDLCIEVFKKLIKNNSKPFLFIFNISSLNKGIDKFNYYKSLIKSYNIEDNFLLLNENLSFVRLIVESDLVIRATNTDGDSLSIREALYYNKKVVASDIISRPGNTILFKTRDKEDLYKKIMDLKDQKSPTESKNINRTNKYFEFFNNIYLN